MLPAIMTAGAVLHRPCPADDGLRIEVRPRAPAGACAVIVGGEIDCRTAPELRDALLAVLDRPDVSGDVLVDLSDVTYLGAAGLRALTVARRAADDAGRVLRLRCGAARAVNRPLQITGLWNSFDVVERSTR
jgi:anti-sigma B factor antagonist